ncbi:RF-1 domain-containing protein [Rhodofomes roseus]|uniref:RF-1 domain-containing protein n=1 Tax=Rhodofomes roseus TaxID=34475 RepID=A0ABQ8K713_9APHY|nr:RF-1 domain-containing protein [Rhodofomes roseus]KAH9832988.1 RF-1 domain-containing protein [Rhodofomes roseus]
MSLRLPRLALILARHAHSGTLPPPPQLFKLENASDSATARAWIDKFKAQEIPKSLVEFTFSRSSGPGGQNVNKVNTKATLRCPLNSSWIPPWARDYIKKTPSYVSSAQCIQITSTVYRSQAQNVQDCLTKLCSLVVDAASASIVNEASEEQKERVRRHQRAEKAKRKIDKAKRSEVKRGRKGSWE